MTSPIAAAFLRRVRYDSRPTAGGVFGVVIFEGQRLGVHVDLVYACTHAHPTPGAARLCASEAVRLYLLEPPTPIGNLENDGGTPPPTTIPPPPPGAPVC